jgi:Family of unknown function (DUF5723)
LTLNRIMARYKILLSLSFFFLLKNVTFSQEQLGIRLENFAGANGTTLNPTHSADYPLRWNLNLVGFGFFIDNSYGYVSNSTIFSLAKNEQEVKFGPSLKGNRPNDVPIADFYEGKRSAYLHENMILNGPSLSVRLGENHTAGLFYNTRFAGSVARVPNDLRYYTLNSKVFNQNFDIPPFSAALMNWDEIGLNYAFKGETSDGFFQIGANFKYLKGYESVYAASKSTFQVARLYNDTLKITQPTVTYGFTNANLGNIQNYQYERQQTGSGFGLDLGFSYLVDNNDYDDYGLKLSAAIIDKTEEHLLNFNNIKVLDVAGFKNSKGPKEAVKRLSYELLSDSTKTLAGSNYSIGLPTALTLQADYQVIAHAFVNATLVQRIPYQEVGVRRGNLLAVSARYEHRWFMVALPIQVYEYQRVRVGLAARAAFLTVGTDYLGSFIRKNNFTGSDIYFAIKMNPLNLGFDTSNWFRGFGKKGKNVECYKF